MIDSDSTVFLVDHEDSSSSSNLPDSSSRASGNSTTVPNSSCGGSSTSNRMLSSSTSGSSSSAIPGGSRSSKSNNTTPGNSSNGGTGSSSSKAGGTGSSSSNSSSGGGGGGGTRNSFAAAAAAVAEGTAALDSSRHSKPENLDPLPVTAPSLPAAAAAVRRIGFPKWLGIDAPVISAAAAARILEDQLWFEPFGRADAAKLLETGCEVKVGGSHYRWWSSPGVCNFSMCACAYGARIFGMAGGAIPMYKGHTYTDTYVCNLSMYACAYGT